MSAPRTNGYLEILQCCFPFPFALDGKAASEHSLPASSQPLSLSHSLAPYYIFPCCKNNRDAKLIGGLLKHSNPYPYPADYCACAVLVVTCQAIDREARGEALHSTPALLEGGAVSDHHRNGRVSEFMMRGNPASPPALHC